MITHFGLFWNEQDVYWGGGSAKSQMWGEPYKRSNKRGRKKNEDKPDAENYGDMKGIYALYDNKSLVYVGKAGKTSSFMKRLQKHRKSKRKNWDQFSWFAIEQNQRDFPDFDVIMKHIEAICIEVANPTVNKQSGSFEKATRVNQIRHPRVEKNTDEKIDTILEDIREIKKQLPSDGK